MKNILLLFVFISISHIVLAQNVSLRKDTILKGKTAYALFKKSNPGPVHYFINSIDGKRLMDVHYSRLDINDKQLFVVTFLNDNRQAMVSRQPGFPVSLIKEIVKQDLVSNGQAVNMQSEPRFIDAHPMPMGYADVDQLIEY